MSLNNRKCVASTPLSKLLPEIEYVLICEIHVNM